MLPLLGIEDIPHILAAGEAGFDKDYKGRLYTARMTVNDVLDRSTFFAIGFILGFRDFAMERGDMVLGSVGSRRRN
jgi:hypothetical protein